MSKYKPCIHVENNPEWDKVLGMCELGEIHECQYCGHVWADTDKRAEYDDMLRFSIWGYDERNGTWIDDPEETISPQPRERVWIEERTGVWMSAPDEVVERVEEIGLQSVVKKPLHELLHTNDDNIPTEPIDGVIATLMLGYRVMEA